MLHKQVKEIQIQFVFLANGNWIVLGNSFFLRTHDFWCPHFESAVVYLYSLVLNQNYHAMLLENLKNSRICD